jgi:hypothetical protein
MVGRIPANSDPIKMTVRWPPHLHTQIKNYANQHNISYSFAVIRLTTHGLEHQRAAGHYNPPATIGCTYTTNYPSSIPCAGPITHLVIYRGPSGRQLEQNTTCEAHQDEALRRPAATRSRMIAELVPLPDAE